MAEEYAGGYYIRFHTYGTGGTGTNEPSQSIGHIGIELVGPDGTSKNYGFYPDVKGLPKWEQAFKSNWGTKGILQDDASAPEIARRHAVNRACWSAEHAVTIVTLAAKSRSWARGHAPHGTA